MNLNSYYKSRIIRQLYKKKKESHITSTFVCFHSSPFHLYKIFLYLIVFMMTSSRIAKI